MKRTLSVIFLFLLSVMPAFAIMTPEEVRSEDYIINHGHSDEMARLMDLQNAQINGDKTQYKSTEPEYYNNKCVKFIRKVFMYIDPGLDDGKFSQHDIKYSPRYDDL